MKNEFDNKMTDKGWQSMRRLLDREMPEQRRRRRFAWWPLALFLLPLAVAGGWWLYRQSGPAPETPMLVPVPAENVQNAGEPVAGIETTFHNVGEPPRSSHQSMTSGGLSHQQETRNVRIPGRSSVTTLSRQTSALSQTPQNRLPQGDLLTAENPATQSAISETYPPESRMSPDIPALNEPFPKWPETSRLATLPVTIQPVENQNKIAKNLTPATTFQPEIKKKQPAPKRWSFGLAAGLASDQFTSINGFSGGAAVNWQLHRQWGLRSGIQYAQYRLPADERPVVSLDAQEYSDATGNFVYVPGTGANPTSQDSAASPVLVPVERLRQLEMPVLFYWQPVRAVRLFGGITTTYTLSTKASEQNYANNQYYYTTDPAAQKSLDNLTEKNWSRWQTNWQAGVGIRLNRHVELGVFYKQSVGNSGQSNASDFDVSGNFDPGPQAATTGGTTHYFLLNGIWFF